MTNTMRIEIDLGEVRRVLRGGFGTNWHAIAEGPMTGAGSSFGGNPRAADDEGWRALGIHADWLGLSFIRANVAQSSYQPAREEFTWESEEMNALRRILDWCESRGADAILQQMWNGVEWNRHPEAADALHSAPHDVAAFALGFASLVERLVRTEGYTCIKWACLTNEPGEGWGWWRGAGDRPVSLSPALAAVRAELDRRGLDVPLVAPDLIGLRPCRPSEMEWDPFIGAYDLHTYLEKYDLKPVGTTEAERFLADWAAWANGRGKPLFLTEFGSMDHGLYHDHPGPASFPAAMKNVEQILRGLHAGIEGFCRWSFTNRGDVDGSWQTVETWDVAEGRLRETFTPRPNAYFLPGLISRFVAKGSALLSTAVSGHPSHREGTGWQQYGLAAALRLPGGDHTLVVQNLTEAPASASVHLAGLTEPLELWRYRVGTPERDRADVILEPVGPFRVSPDAPNFDDDSPGMSVTVYSTLRLSHGETPPWTAGR